MDNIRVLVVEDNPVVADSIAIALKRNAMTLVATCPAGEEAVDHAMHVPVDLILMDIELRGALDGISTAKLIRNERDVPVIFLTDYDDQRTVERAMKSVPSNYLSKPFNEAELVRAIRIAVNNSTKRGFGNPQLKDSIFLRIDNQKFDKIYYNDIILLRANRSYCEIVTEQKVHTLSASMREISDQLEDPGFVKVHRSVIVNIRKANRVDGNTLHLGKHEVVMSREYRDEVLRHMNIVK